MLVINYDRQHSIFNYELNMVKKRDSGASVLMSRSEHCLSIAEWF